MATKLSVNLVIDRQSGRLLFAEAGKDFIDFLFSLLTLPLSTITNLLTKKRIGMVGCLGRLYESVRNLSKCYIQPNQSKNDLLYPKISLPPKFLNPSLFLQNDPSTSTKKHYTCGSCSDPSRRYFTDFNGLMCPHCNGKMSTELTYTGLEDIGMGLDGVGSGGGYVKSEVTYMVMDDLMVTPMSTFSTLALLKKFKVRDVSLLEESVVEVGMEEGLALLKASLLSKTVLTDVFISKQVKEEKTIY